MHIQLSNPSPHAHPNRRQPILASRALRGAALGARVEARGVALDDAGREVLARLGAVVVGHRLAADLARRDGGTGAGARC